ncbi:hypothetical protein GCM10007111_19910 [Virgibacillus kapii]|uniref:Uncharacterized protein n=1 Tax=Virgibacillus kapii TaxID=1638645 RepID=A0ABQ2DJM3_9BACI|nr:hypothetical protein M948_04540 [Virgibacillus sp. CM-4]GGJ57875.1 hypothetical protein GCM10007111_19910 [Virgibacillus kapii]
MSVGNRGLWKDFSWFEGGWACHSLIIKWFENWHIHRYPRCREVDSGLS